MRHVCVYRVIVSVTFIPSCGSWSKSLSDPVSSNAGAVLTRRHTFMETLKTGGIKQITFSKERFWACLLIKELAEWRLKHSALSAYSRYFINAFIDWYMGGDEWKYAKFMCYIISAGVCQGIRRNEISDTEKKREDWFVTRHCWCSPSLTNMSKRCSDMEFPNPNLSKCSKIKSMLLR